MRTLFLPAGALVTFLLVCPTNTLAAAKVAADIVPLQKRQISVKAAEDLVLRKPPAPLPADLPSPFNPVDFDKPDPSEVPVAPPPKPTAPAGIAGQATVVAQPVGPATDRETLVTLASQITPSGVIMLRGTPRLIFANKPFEVGTRFTASYNGLDYELELVAIDRTTFTLRYRGEEITRPIKPVR
jgi:hypothetical protein